ncbi:metallophosphoesterase [Massilia sp. 9096]|uniref:STAND family AAA ATPase n=1 Tax=Massilia sp. 9096 TaxID=1500894 RepID=UPI0009DC98AA|nr:metallophosphoesterase [Massilia sp. 9096]
MKLCVLHLSDIHFHTTGNPVLERASAIAASAFSAARSADACLIAVTGDIAFSGNSLEYQVARYFFDEIKREISSETGRPVYVILVPGNHDCALKPVDEIREIVIQQMVQKPELAEKTQIISQCVAVQKEFFAFREAIGFPSPLFDEPQWSEYELDVLGEKIRVSAVNAAWMSRLPETPGNLLFPVRLYEGQLSAPSDLRLVMLHQPYHWHQQRSYHEMKTLLRRHATAVLNGHEHVSNSGTVDDTLSGNSLYFEAGALQPHESGLEPQYAIYQFDTDNHNVAITRLVIKSNEITEVNATEIRDLPSASDKNSALIEFRSEWLADLDNPGGYFTHADKQNVLIDDIFVYPDLKDWGNDEAGKVLNFSSERLLNQVHESGKFLLLGEERAGKTTLLHVYAKQLMNAGFAPVYVRATDMSNVRRADDVGARLARSIEKQYTSPRSLDGLPKNKRVLLVDDIDHFKSGVAAIPVFLEYAEQHYGSIVMTADKAFEATALASHTASEAFGRFPKFEILRFGLKLRHRLIKKWCGMSQLTSLAELDRRVDHAENIVNSVIGRNLVPQLPIYLLILLQSCDQHQQGEIQNSGFSHYYQFLITRSLGQVGVKPQEIDEHYNYLSHLAWFMQSKELRELDIEYFRVFNNEFSATFTSVELQARLRLLVEARVLSKRGDCYSFAYPYVYFFFVGKYLSMKIYTDPKVEAWVVEACSKLYVRSNANAVLLLTHHDSNPWVIKKIAEVMKSCFHEKKPMELNGDTGAVNKLVTNASQLVLKASSVDKNQEELRGLNDEIDKSEDEVPDACPDENGELAFVAKFTLLFKTAEILGQILKNYYGSLEKPFKAELLREVFDGPLRALGLLLEAIDEDMEAFVSYIGNVVLKDDKSLSLEGRSQLARKTSFNILGWLGTSVVSASAYFVATDKLREDVAALVRSNPTVAYRLIDMGTRLVRPGHMPLEEIDKLAKELKDNHYAFGILQALGVNHLYQYHTDAAEKQRLCNILKISMDGAKTIELQGRDTKLISKK